MHIPVPLLLAQEAVVESGTFFSDFDSNQRFVLAIVGLSGAIFLILILGGVLAGVWSSFKEKQIEADLKRDMLDRGMTPDEIQKVIEATPRSGFDKWWTNLGNDILRSP
jgi:hypothetical protein